MATALLALSLAGCATTTPPPPPQAVKPTPQEIKAQVVAELQVLEEGKQAKSPVKPTYDIPITVNAQVERWINYFTVRNPKTFRRWLQRSGRYAPMMRAILKDYGLPEDLIYLAMIESGFNCSAYSRAHAVGPWQFIRATGKRYNLKIDYWVDERRDPVKATHAAAKYLSELYAEFGSWYLAAAGYNAGEGKIRRALSRYKADDYWEISHKRRRYLKLETKHYVPKMLAAAIIAKEPAKYGFTGLVYAPPMAYDKVTVAGGTSLAISAKLAGVKKKVLTDLNPHLRRGCAPPHVAVYTLRIPKGQKARFETAYAKLTPKQRKARPDIVTVRVERGDTLGGIAIRYGVRLSDLMSLNAHLNPRRMRIGQKVMVPPGRYRATPRPRRSTYTQTASRKTTTRKGNKKVVHTVRRGETYWLIAQRYGVDWRSIKRWNKRRSSRIKPGQKLVLYVPGSSARAKAKATSAPKASATRRSSGTIMYTVRRGDNLWVIAKRFKVSAAQIKRWNKMRSSKLMPGQRLVVGMKTKSTKPAKAAKARSTGGGSTTYTVRRGDNLWLIAKRFKVSPTQLRRWNKMHSNRLMPGDTLTIRNTDES